MSGGYTLAINLVTRVLRDVAVGELIKLPEVDISELANPKCKDCLGRGRIGYDVTKQQVEPCKCTRLDMVKKLVSLKYKYGLLKLGDDAFKTRDGIPDLVAAQAEEYRKIIQENKPKPSQKSFWGRLADVFQHIWWKLTDGRDKDVVAVVKQIKGRTAVKTVKEYDLLKEGPVKKGGVNPPPKTAKPEYTPVPQKSSSVLNKNMSGK